LSALATKILDLYKFEPKKRCIEELVDTDESDFTSFDNDMDEGTDEEDESDYTQDDEDDEAPINA